MAFVNMVACPHCNNKILSATGFCKNCGRKISQTEWRPIPANRSIYKSKIRKCSKCNKVYEGYKSNDNFCGDCGGKIIEEEIEEINMYK